MADTVATGSSRRSAAAAAVGTILISVLTSVVTTGLQSEADISYRDATRFVQGYYRDVSNPNLRDQVYADRQTDTFQSFPGNDHDSFAKFYDRIDRIDVLKTYPIASESNRYFVELEFRPKRGRASTEEFKFYLSCDNLLARLPVITCPDGAVRIDVVQKVEAG